MNLPVSSENNQTIKIALSPRSLRDASARSCLLSSHKIKLSIPNSFTNKAIQ